MFIELVPEFNNDCIICISLKDAIRAIVVTGGDDKYKYKTLIIQVGSQQYNVWRSDEYKVSDDYDATPQVDECMDVFMRILGLQAEGKPYIRVADLV